MVRAMFGMGGSEILVILIVALLFLGPDKLPDAAKKISKGIRDIKRQSRALQQTIEDDEHIGGAIRDLRSALRGDEEPVRPKPVKPILPPKQLEASPTPDGVAAGLLAATAADHASADAAAAFADGPPAADGEAKHGSLDAAAEAHASTSSSSIDAGAGAAAHEAAVPTLTLPPMAGERDGAPPPTTDAAELAQLVKPAPHTIARGQSVAAAEPVPAAAPAEAEAAATSSEPNETKHG
jgi:sec-independent protein translocase protein TatB